MRIEIVGRNVEVTEELDDLIRKRFRRLSRQVSELARLHVVLREETNPSIARKEVAEATLHLKGVTLHAEESAETMSHAVRELCDDIKRQVKRHRELRRKRTTTRRLVGAQRRSAA